MSNDSRTSGSICGLSAQERYRLVADFTYDWEHWIGPDGKLQYVSPSVERITAHKPPSGGCAFTFLERVVHAEDRAQMLSQLSEQLKRPSSGEAEFRVVRPDGQVRWVHHCWQPMFDASGAFLGLRGSNRDVTERKVIESECAAARAAAEQARVVTESAVEGKDRFIGILAHELRTPLAPAVTTLYVLDSDPRLAPGVRDHLAGIRRNVELVLRVISDLLDINRMTTGDVQLHKRPTDVAAIIRESVSMVSDHLNAKEMSLTCTMPSERCIIQADPDRLLQVFWHLLRNAIKFSPPGTRIEVRASVTRCEAGGELEIEIRDEGCGIDADLLPRLFNAFEQDSKARALGGLGLGLCVCRTIVEMHDGVIWAHSDGLGRGSTFTVNLPLA